MVTSQSFVPVNETVPELWLNVPPEDVKFSGTVRVPEVEVKVPFVWLKTAVLADRVIAALPPVKVAPEADITKPVPVFIVRERLWVIVPV